MRYRDRRKRRRKRRRRKNSTRRGYGLRKEERESDPGTDREQREIHVASSFQSVEIEFMCFLLLGDPVLSRYEESRSDICK